MMAIRYFNNNIFYPAVFLLFSIVTVGKLNAQDTNPKSIIEKYFSIYSKNKIEKSLDYLFSTNQWFVNNSKEDINNIKLKLNNLNNHLGEYYGVDYLTKKSMGENLILYTYLIKYEKQPVKFTFVFYRPDNKWMIYDFEYTRKLVTELEDAAKAYRLKENIDF